jgi:hypothetical protein
MMMEDDMNSLRTSFLLATMVLAACGDSKDDDTGADTDDTDAPTCVSGIASTFPAQNDTAAFYRTSVEVTFNQDESDSSTLTLKDGGGADVAGTVTYSADGKIAYFDPTADLMPSTQYTLTVAYSCDKTADISFTTADFGTAVDASTLIGKTYSVDFLSGRITEPAGVGELLTGLLGGTDPIYILVGPTAITEGGQIEMLGALGALDGTDIVQDVCTPSIVFPIAADYSENPFFTIEGEDVSLEVEGFALDIAQLALSGAFSADGTQIGGLAIDAFADTRGLVEVLGEDLGIDPSNPAGLCTFISGLLPTVQCQDCGGGDEPYCLKLVIDSMVGVELPGVTLESLVQADVDANPACAEE